jgi:hypothetical protein
MINIAKFKHKIAIFNSIKVIILRTKQYKINKKQSFFSEILINLEIIYYKILDLIIQVIY